MVVIQICAKCKREFEAHSWPGLVHQGWRKASSGARPQSTFSCILQVSLGKYGGELAMVLEEVTVTWLSRQMILHLGTQNPVCLLDTQLMEMCPSSGRWAGTTGMPRQRCLTLLSPNPMHLFYRNKVNREIEDYLNLFWEPI